MGWHGTEQTHSSIPAALASKFVDDADDAHVCVDIAPTSLVLFSPGLFHLVVNSFTEASKKSEMHLSLSYKVSATKTRQSTRLTNRLYTSQLSSTTKQYKSPIPLGCSPSSLPPPHLSIASTGGVYGPFRQILDLDSVLVGLVARTVVHSVSAPLRQVIG